MADACKHCGAALTPHPLGRTPVYCSPRCSLRARHARERARKRLAKASAPPVCAPWAECDYCGGRIRTTVRGRGDAHGSYCSPFCCNRACRLRQVEAGTRASTATLGDWEVEARDARYRRMAEVARDNPELPLPLLLERFNMGAEEAEPAAGYLRRAGLHFPADYRLADVPAP